MCPAVQITFDARERQNEIGGFCCTGRNGPISWILVGAKWKKTAYEQVDESHIPVYRILHQGKDSVGAARKRTIDILLLEQETQGKVGRR